MISFTEGISGRDQASSFCFVVENVVFVVVEVTSINVVHSDMSETKGDNDDVGTVVGVDKEAFVARRVTEIDSQMAGDERPGTITFLKSLQLEMMVMGEVLIALE